MEHDTRKMMESRKGKYLLVNGLARRVRALQSGSKPLVTVPDGDLMDVAVEEFRQGKIRLTTHTEEEPEEPQEGL
jgi:DNA-directed RNA polymerase subunit K/omega